ncbi:NupC/NupG family nucleoside CNT transporter [Thiotrichales bacterium 19S9-12]|nr:NupC/NupG family nucleoside CNT transporter [Thiotrichales bacterium 19S9-11]MCF6811611.1 NupC/NupG family nucleoside CNT transporter [Thiotrichales bacterium 19S9-12]
MIVSKLFHFSLGLVVFFALLYLVSMNKKEVRKKLRFILQLLVLEVILAYVLLASALGQELINIIADGFGHLMSYAQEGTNFVFGSVSENSFTFFFNVLMPIVLVSALIGILQYFRILPLIIRFIGWLLSKVNGMGKLESFNAVSSLVLGQSENFIVYKNILTQISPRRMYTMAATAMSTVSLGIVGAYMQLINPKYIIAALILNMVSTFIVLHILNPYDHRDEINFEVMEGQTSKKETFFEMLSDYILDGFKIAIIVGAMMIGFIALIAMINQLFLAVFGISFQDLLGYVFYPFAWLLGISGEESLKAGSVMATKLVSNEFVAMTYLKEQLSHFSTHSIAIISVFLVSFANFSSIGVIVGAIQALNKDKAKFVAKHGWRLVFGATMVSFLSALVTGLVI